MSKQLLPTNGRLGNAIVILCACAFLAIVASSDPRCYAADPSAASSASLGDSMTFGGEVAKWRFSRSEDVDFDSWPEGWVRKIDRDHPPYLPIRIVANDPALLSIAQAADLRLMQAWPDLEALVPGLPGLPPSIGDIVAGRHLRIELDGGWAMVQSPRVLVDSLYRYKLELSAKTEALVHDHAYAELVFLGPQGETIASHRTNALTGTSRWQPLVSDLALVPEGAVWMVVRLVLRPIKLTGSADIRGAAVFDDVTIRRLPQMQITSDQRFALYEADESPLITVRVLGLERRTANMHFIVRDVDGRVVAGSTVEFTEITHGTPAQSTDVPNKPVELPKTSIKPPAATRLGLDDNESMDFTEQSSVAVDTNTRSETKEQLPLLSTDPASDGLVRKDALNDGPLTDEPVYKVVVNDGPAIEGVAQWKVPVLRPGFYTIESLLGELSKPALRSETTFAVLASLPPIAGANPYGWTLPKTPVEEIEIKRVPDWLQRLGVGVVKYPCWFAPDDFAQLETTAWVVGRLHEKEIRTIGMLDVPPEKVLAKIDERERREPYAANFFRDVAVWQPLLEPIMTRLSLKVRTWQLGSDDDFSFLGRPNLKQTIKDIARDLQGFGQPIGVAISWPWLEPLPPTKERSWDAMQLSTATSLAAEEMDAYLREIETSESSKRERSETWVRIDPLDAADYDRDTRITDLVLRMTTVRGHRVPATFVSDPTSKSNGLLRPDWRPSELLLPWRTTATLLRDLTRTGSLPVPGGSTTIVLANATRTTIVISNPTQTTERIFLGDAIRQIDVWGNATVPKKLMIEGKPYHEINVGPVPTFLVDVDPVLVAFRMSTRLVQSTLDSLLGRRQTISLEFSNPTREILSGEVRLKPQPDWEIDSRPQSFDIPAGRTSLHAFDVALRNSAKIGDAPLEFDFILRTQPARRFSVTRTLRVGPEGLDIEVTTRLVSGELQILLTMTNQSPSESRYDCMLFPPGGRQYQRRQITIPPGATVKRLFPWADGQSLLGQKMLLRAVEQNGDRVLNQIIEITP